MIHEGFDDAAQLPPPLLRAVLRPDVELEGQRLGVWGGLAVGYDLWQKELQSLEDQSNLQMLEAEFQCLWTDLPARIISGLVILSRQHGAPKIQNNVPESFALVHARIS